MDQDVVRFRKQTLRENPRRRGIQRRYSETLRQQAITHLAKRQRAGVGLKQVAEELGVAPWSLYRWATRSRARGGFQEVAVVEPAPRRREGVVVLTPQGFRVEGLDVEDVVRVLSGLR
jgi:transposase